MQRQFHPLNQTRKHHQHNMTLSAVCQGLPSILQGVCPRQWSNSCLWGAAACVLHQVIGDQRNAREISAWWLSLAQQLPYLRTVCLDRTDSHGHLEGSQTWDQGG